MSFLSPITNKRTAISRQVTAKSYMESRTTRGPKKYSLRHGQPPATLRNPGSEDDHWGETKVNICQEVSLASDTTGFHSINNTEATSDPDPHTVVFDNFGDTQTNDNFGPTQAKDSPLISTEKNLSINQQTSDTVKGISSKPNKHKSDQPKSTRDARRKRVRAEAFENTVIFLGSDSEDEIEVVPTLLVNSQPKSSTGSIDTTDDEVEYRRKPNKRPRLTKEDMASLPVTARPNSPDDSGKASDDEPKGRRKSNTRRVTTRESKGHFDAEVMWWDTTTARCKALRKFLAEQSQLIATLDTLDTEQCQIVAEMSADRLPRSTRLQLSRELGELEERRSKATAELREATKSATGEGAAMKQDLEQWCTKDKKITERIERSR
ncbi:hypothetical protein F5Y09DRAFT_85711 [Xylaria sp. FL1042]|nr:hypothetical protein F5Y09DRAFT_85711 [Xylaria sp. FL1042]